MATIQIQNITGDELCKAACCNLSESFETNASVDVNFSDALTGAKHIRLLGLNGTYVQIMTENYPNLRGIASNYGLGYIPGSWMEAIQISKGTSSVINGYESITGQINIEYKKPRGKEKYFVNLFGNSEGKTEMNFNTSFKLNEKWSTMVLGHAENMFMESDENQDFFIDHPLTRQYNFINRWDYFAGDFTARFGFKVLDEERIGGHTSSFNQDNTLAISKYEILVNTRRYEGFAKFGYVLAGDKGANISGLFSASLHDQDSKFGLTTYNAEQESFYGRLTYQSNIANENHKYTTGVDYKYDKYTEILNDSLIPTEELVRELILSILSISCLHLDFWLVSGWTIIIFMVYFTPPLACEVRS